MENNKLKSLLLKIDVSENTEDTLVSLNESLAKNLRSAYGSGNGSCTNNTSCDNNGVCSGNSTCNGNGTCEIKKGTLEQDNDSNNF